MNRSAHSPLPPLLFAALLACALEVQGAEPDPHRLDTLVVVGSRVAEPLRQAVATVSALEREALEREGATRLDDLAGRIPGLEAVAEPARFGLQGFNLRGLEGNRVSIEIDGVPMPDGFGVGDLALAGRDLLELDALERVEVLRGPASTLYGSKALAGVVALSTRAPEDLPWHEALHAGSVRFGLDGRDHAALASALVARRSQDERWSGFVSLSQRALQHTRNHPRSGGTRANPARGDRGHLLASLAFLPDADARWGLTVEQAEGERSTEVDSLIFAPGRFATTYDLDAEDRWRRRRLSLELRRGAPLPGVDELVTRLFRQQADTRQDTHQWRLPDRPGTNPTRRDRRFDFAQDTTGLEGVAQTRIEALGLRHWHVYGFDLVRHDYANRRDGRQTDLVTGTGTHVVLGEVFPVRDFPRTTVQEAGLFWQDEIALSPRWAVVPGVRVEHYRLRPRNDALWAADNPDAGLAHIRSTRATPKLGLRFTPGDHTTLYLQAVRGYRAPPFSDVNIGLYLPTLDYEVRGNPGLKPETSTGVEAGLRWSSERLDLALALYRNHYRDLIDSRAALGPDPVTGTLVFQSVNRARARIRGIELEMQWRPAWAEFDAADLGFELIAAQARGDDTARDQPLDTVAPGRLALGLRLDTHDGRCGGLLRFTGVRSADRIDQSAGARFRPPGYGRLDLHLWQALGDRTELRLGLTNLADRRYWDWRSSRGLGPDAPTLDLHTAPGRALSAQLRVEW